MKKVLFMIPWFSQGGVEHSLITALNNLPSEEFDVSLFIRSDETDLVSELPSHINIILNKKGHFYRNPRAFIMILFIKIFDLMKLKEKKSIFEDKLDDYVYRKKLEYPLKNVLKDKNYDVIVSYTVDDCTEMATLIPAKRRYVFYHTPYVDFKRAMMERVMPYYDGIVACGPGVFNELKKSFRDKECNIKLLSNYVDIEEILEKANEEMPDRYKYMIRKNLTLCTCGRIASQKRYDLAVEAARILRERGIDFKWIFVGGGDLESEIQNLIEKYCLQDNVYITGNQSNPYPFIKNCDIYVQTSGFEAQPLTLIEAMKLGRPIVSTNTLGGITVLENGKRGILTDISAESIAKGIFKYIDNPILREKMKIQYTLEKDISEKQEYIRNWSNLLNE